MPPELFDPLELPRLLLANEFWIAAMYSNAIIMAAFLLSRRKKK